MASVLAFKTLNITISSGGRIGFILITMVDRFLFLLNFGFGSGLLFIFLHKIQSPWWPQARVFPCTVAPPLELVLNFDSYVHHIFQLHIMLQSHRISNFLIQTNQEPSHISLSVIFYIYSNHSDFHLFIIVLHTSITLCKALQFLVQFIIVMAWTKPSPYQGFHFLPCLYWTLSISFPV